VGIECDFNNSLLKCQRCGATAPCANARANCVLPHEKIKRLAGVGETQLPSNFDLAPVQPRGPGTELSKLLKRFGIEPTPTCKCRAKAAEMDAWGCDEATKPERIREVVAVMREEANARGLPFLDAAGRVLVRRAITNARKAEAARAKEAQQKGPPAV
jgi:hypothetical protein